MSPLRRLASLPVLIAWASAAPQAVDIVGSWRGTSLCVDKTHFPACHDEQVIYDVRGKGSVRDTVTVRADKVVNGVREFMAEFDFHLVADGSWVADYQTARVHFQIALRVRGAHMTGSLTDEPTGRRVRAISLERIP